MSLVGPHGQFLWSCRLSFLFFSPWSSSLRRRGGFFEDGEVLERFIVEGGVQGVSPQTRGV